MSKGKSFISAVQIDKKVMVEYPVIIEEQLSLKIQLASEADTVQGKKVVVIVLHPTSVEDKAAAISLNKMASWFGDNNQPLSLSQLQLCYLFPFYCEADNKLASSLSQLIELGDEGTQQIKAALQNNKQHMQKAIASAQLIVFAWGNPPKAMTHSMFYKQVNQVLKLVRKAKKQAYVFDMTHSKLDRVASLTEQGNPQQPSKGRITGLSNISIDPLFGIQVNTFKRS